ncbi:alkyl hydroperoxide reductase [Gammaproteobacteria bacterium 45_16_T64]|nr:alkyl hydroperoxide reductase [Gammaproteobacteria bacterium 45_16_T64]
MTNLTETIADLRVEFERAADSKTLEIMSTATADLAATGVVNHSVKTGDKAPTFQLKSHIEDVISLTDLLSKGKVVLSFYRGGWCPYCNLELSSLQQVKAEIEATGATLVAISPETPDFASLTHEKNELGYDILFDEGNSIAKAYGLEFELDERLRPVYKNFGLDIPAHNGEDTFKLPIPATYVINQNGTIDYHFVDADYIKRLEPKEVLNHL